MFGRTKWYTDPDYSMDVAYKTSEPSEALMTASQWKSYDEAQQEEADRKDTLVGLLEQLDIAAVDGDVQLIYALSEAYKNVRGY